jgi:hypothetical protein
MAQELVINYLKEHGECFSSDIQIPTLTKKSIVGILSRLVDAKQATRRQGEAKGRTVWVYSMRGTIPKEPEHIYILRNLPRNS